MYGTTSRVSPIRRISSEKSKKYFLLKSTPNLLKRIENHFWNVFGFFLKKIFIWDKKKSRFSLDIATLVHHCSQTSNPITKWLGTVVHLHVEKLQLFSNFPSPVTSGGGSVYNPYGFVTDIYINRCLN